MVQPFVLWHTMKIVRACLHVPSVHLTVRMGSEPILSVKWSISIDTIVNFDGDGDGHGDEDGTCKQALI